MNLNDTQDLIKFMEALKTKEFSNFSQPTYELQEDGQSIKKKEKVKISYNSEKHEYTANFGLKNVVISKENVFSFKSYDEDGQAILFKEIWNKKIKEEKEKELDAWWVTADGKKLKVSDMQTSHLFNSLRLVYNKLVEPKHRIDVKDAKNFTATFPNEDSKHILKAMFYQIGLRENITESQLTKLVFMAEVVRRTL